LLIIVLIDIGPVIFGVLHSLLPSVALLLLKFRLSAYIILF